jgi:hypothetical protein
MSLVKLRSSVQQAVNAHQAVLPYTRTGSALFWLENLLLLFLVFALPNWTEALPAKMLPSLLFCWRMWHLYKKSRMPPSSLKLVNGEVTMPPDMVLETLLAMCGRKVDEGDKEEIASALALDWITRHPQSGLYTAAQISGLCKFWSLRV